MKQTLEVKVIGRRDFLIGASSGVAVAALLSAATIANAQDQLATIDAALKKVLGDAKPIEGKITLDLPEIAENGNTVPFSLTVDSPMTAQDHVKVLHVFAAGNPQVGVASYDLTPDSGKASVSSRMRLAKTQDVVAVAELSDGKFLLGKRTVKVTIGGCGG